MRRTDRQINSRAEIDQIIAAAGVCRLALSRDGQPYLVPVSFGYDGQKIYFHSAMEGMKIEYMTANPRVCFELEQDVRVVRNEELACKWGQLYASVIGFGTVHEVTGPAERRAAMNQVMRHYSGREWDFDPDTFAQVRLWCISIDQLTGKRRSA